MDGLERFKGGIYVTLPSHSVTMTLVLYWLIFHSGGNYLNLGDRDFHHLHACSDPFQNPAMQETDPGQVHADFEGDGWPDGCRVSFGAAAAGTSRRSGTLLPLTHSTLHLSNNLFC